MKIYIVSLFIMLAISASAQTDSTNNKKQDTIKIGSMIIIGDHSTKSDEHGTRTRSEHPNKRNGIYIKSFGDTIVSINDDNIKVGRIKIINKNVGDSNYGNKSWNYMLDGDFKKTKISIEKKSSLQRNITTNWWIFDIGFANLVDHTSQLMYSPNYSFPYQSMLPYGPNSANLKLNNAKSSNVNIWIVQQKVNLYQHKWNLKYGIGIEMYNFRFEQPISFRNTPGSYVYFDNVNFSKNKLYVGYLTVPVQLNYRANPENKKSFSASIGLSGGYLLESRTKQISAERGKQKLNGNFDLNNVKAATIGELGIGSLRLYGSYSLTNLFDKNLTNFDMAPFAIGVRFINSRF